MVTIAYRCQVVDRDSATTDLAKDTILIDKDHSGLNKCYSRDDRLYQELHSVICEVLDESRTDSYMLKNRVKGNGIPIDLYTLDWSHCSELTNEI